MEQQYAIITSGGKQYRVAVDQTVTVEKLPVKEGAKVTFDKVLMLHDDSATIVGAPYIDQASVLGEVASQFRGVKLIHSRYKNKTHGATRRGHRQHLTSVRITKITFPKTPKTPKTTKTAKKVKATPNGS